MDDGQSYPDALAKARLCSLARHNSVPVYYRHGEEETGKS